MLEIGIFIIQVVFVLSLLLGLASLCIWIERKGSALIQDRIGANRAGAFFESENPLINSSLWFVRLMGKLGVINTLLCDGLKAILKEDFIPEGVNNFVHSLAPFMAVFPIFVAYALVPFAPDFDLFGYHIRPQVASLDAGILFIFAMGSISVYGVAFAGWTGNNKYSLLGGLRASAQMISYEIAMGISLVTIILTYGTLDLYEIVERQWHGLGIFQTITQPLSFVILFIVGMAETKRGPFDLPESESELAAGYFTEYSGMKFLMFWLGEFAEIALFGILITVLFFGGWRIPFYDLPAGSWVSALIGHMVFMAKVMFFCIMQIVIRWSLPRFRYDHLMNLGWKILLPLSLVNLMVTAFLVVR